MDADSSMMSELNFQYLPPLPDSPVAPARTFPDSPFQLLSRAQSQNIHTATAPEYHSVRPRIIDQDIDYTQKSPRRSPTKQTDTARIPSNSSDNYLPTSFLLRSPGGHLSPTKVPLPPSPIRSTYVSPARPACDLDAAPPSPIRERHTSPCRPAHPLSTRGTLSAHRLGSPAKAGAGDESFLLPQSRRSDVNHLSQSMIADMSMPELMSLEIDESLEFRPRAGLKSTGIDDVSKRQMGERPSLQKDVRQYETSPVRKERSPTKSESRKPLPTPSRHLRSPVKPPPSTSKTKRTFPASSSHNTLSRLGEEALDVSTLLPQSPARMDMAHMMGEEHQLLRQSLPMSEGDTFIFSSPPPPLSVARMKTPRKAVSPSKGREGDMTMDVIQMMARMTKPKRPSGTEESFEDLLHGEPLDMDDVMGMDSIIPPDLRPRTKSLGSHFRSTHTASVKNMNLPSNLHTKTVTAHPIPSRQRLTADPASPVRSSQSPIRHMSPARAAAVPTPTEAPMASPSARRPAPPPVSSRRVSLSTGALPLSKPASYTKMELPKPTEARHERIRSAMHPSAVIDSTRQTALPRPRSERELAPKSAITASRPPAVTSSSARMSVMPTSARLATARTGSTQPSIPAGPPTTRTMPPPSRPTSFRPTSMAPSKSSLPPMSTRPAPSAPRPGLVRPSAPPRAFGTDGVAQTNRLSTRPTATTSGLPSKSSSVVAGKLSIAPISSPSRRETTMKSRAASTPAETVARTMVRPSATTRTKTSIPPPATRSAGGSALLRPSSRIPAGGKLSAGPAATGNAGRGAANLASLRARIDEMTARQAASRRA